MIRVTCPKCIEKAKKFLLKAGLSADCLHWDKKGRDDLIVARDTKVKLREQWRQERHNRKRPAIWKPEHRIKLIEGDQSSFYSRSSIVHLCVRNTEHSSAQLVLWCEAPDCFTLTGPGAEAQIAADAEAVAARDAREHYAEYEKAQKEANSREIHGYCQQIEAAFSALGYDVSAHGGLVSHHANRISIDADTAGMIVAALGGLAPNRPIDPMPVWRVRYGEDDYDPMLLGARTEAGVRAHMMANYCDERRDDGPNVPLDPTKLHIEPVPMPEKPADDEAS